MLLKKVFFWLQCGLTGEPKEWDLCARHGCGVGNQECFCYTAKFNVGLHYLFTYGRISYPWRWITEPCIVLMSENTIRTVQWIKGDSKRDVSQDGSCAQSSPAFQKLVPYRSAFCSSPHLLQVTSEIIMLHLFPNWWCQQIQGLNVQFFLQQESQKS